jgi:hypothetical protein
MDPLGMAQPRTFAHMFTYVQLGIDKNFVVDAFFIRYNSFGRQIFVT